MLSFTNICFKVICPAQVQRFISSNPAEVDDFFQNIQVLNTCPPGGALSCGPEPGKISFLAKFNPEY